MLRDCPQFGLCGGCTYYELPYREEIKLKEQLIFDILSPVVGQDIYQRIYRGITPSPSPLAYRNKMEFSFGDEKKGGELMLGMHKKRSFYDIVDAGNCIIVDDDIRQIVQSTTAFFRQRQIPYYHKKTNQGFLRHLLVRKAAFTGQIMVDLITTSSMEDDIVKQWAEMICEIDFNGELVSLLHTRNDRCSDVVEDQGTDVLFGRDWICEKLLGYEFKITPFSFFQTNSRGAEKLYDAITKLIPQTGVIYDLYSGTGTIAQIISGYAQAVVGVEIVEQASLAAEINAKNNNISNCSFVCGDVLKVLDEIDKLPDVIIVDPPREGVVPKALDKILNYGVEQIIYVSCKAQSLRRDMDKFIEKGYMPDHIEIVDMFPGTANTETICRFTKSN